MLTVCGHDLPRAVDWQGCVVGCRLCGRVFESVDRGGWRWKRRSKRWLRRRLRDATGLRDAIEAGHAVIHADLL